MGGPLEKLLGLGGHGHNRHDALINTRKLEQALDLMKQDPSLSFDSALKSVDVDLTQVPEPVLRELVQSQPPEVQQQVAQWASENTGSPLVDPSFRNESGQGTAFDRGSAQTAASGMNQPAGTGTATTPSNAAAVGNAYANGATAPALAPGVQIVPATTQLVGNTLQAPSPLIQRIFSGEGTPRSEHGNANGTQPGSSQAVNGSKVAEAVRTDNVVAMVRGESNQIGQADRFQQQAPQSPSLQRATDGIPAGRQEGNAAQAQSLPAQARTPDIQSPAQPTALQTGADARAAGHTGFAQQVANASPNAAQPQGAAQAASFTQQQSAAQLSPQGAVAQQFANGQQPNAVPLAQGRPETLGGQQQQLPQQALLNPQQSAPALQAQPQGAAVTAAAVAPQLAGLTVVANPQAPIVNPQLNQSAVPLATGTENASQVRNALLAPAGHTMAGFLRRDHRGGESPQRRRRDSWLIALAPHMRGHRAAIQSAGTGAQWLFWITTLAAYGALVAAVVAMVPSGGRLLNDAGNPTSGAYALALCAVAAALSWWLGKRLSRNGP